ncbi:MAG: transglutaminase-like domain-containing protein [Pseudomonadota bacterium]
MNHYLSATFYFDYENPAVKAYAESVAQGAKDALSLVQQAYLRVRDDFRYNPYMFTAKPSDFTASSVLEKKQSYCIPKAVLLGAVARYHGIPSRVGFSDVTNHLSDAGLTRLLQSDVFTMHGYIELQVNQRWVKATPAFNAALCQRMQVEPLAFNGKEDSIFQEFTHDGARYMEYLKDYGTFDDVPREFILEKIKTAYPHLAEHLETGFPSMKFMDAEE